GGKVLCYVERKDAHIISSVPQLLDEVSEDEARIVRGPLSNTPELHGMEEAVLNTLFLDAVSNDFLNKFGNSVEEDDGSKPVRGLIVRLVRLGDNDRSGFLESSRPVGKRHT